MNKKQFRSQASSGRLGDSTTAFGASGFGTSQSSVLSYIQEPLDYTQINEANVVVALKNLSKKDGTTKAKALEDLQTLLSVSSAEIEESFLEAWTKLFPRLSVDNTRRVRQLAHSLNGLVCEKCGKRIARHMPRIAGPWLAGTFDNDRVVSRAAAVAMDAVFPTPEKVYGVSRTFQRSILEFCRASLLQENVQTLSDSRTTSADDAEALYARVVSTSLSVIEGLLEDLTPEDRKKERELYEEICGDAKLWEFAYHRDASVRRAIHQLLQACLERQPDLVNHNANNISTAYIYKGLNSDQLGSALNYVQALVALTSAIPTVWTSDYSGKRPSVSRLRHFLKQGSRSAPVEFWGLLRQLFSSLPPEVWPNNEGEIAELLADARVGVASKEDRFNASAAWPAYFALVGTVSRELPDSEAEKTLDSSVMPIVRQYLDPAPETAEWSVGSAKAALLVSEVVKIAKVMPLLLREWPLYADNIIEAAKMSQPEQSKEYNKSQSHVAAMGERWSDLQREIWSTTAEAPEALQHAFVETDMKVLNECIRLIRTRKGKPYGAAAVIEQLLRACAKYLMLDKAFRDTYFSFVDDELETFLFSPSQKHLVQSLYEVHSDTKFQTTFARLISSIIRSEEASRAIADTLRAVLSRSAPPEAITTAKAMPEFQDFLVQSTISEEHKVYVGLLPHLMGLSVLSDETSDAVLAHLTRCLTIAEQQTTILNAIDNICSTNEDAVRAFMTKSDGEGEHLLPSVLQLEQEPNDAVAEKATALFAKLSSVMTNIALDQKSNIVLQSLLTTSKTSLPMDSVNDLTDKLLGTDPDDKEVLDVLPSTEAWLDALLATVTPLRPSLALLSPLGGTVHVIQSDAVVSNRVAYDSEGFSQALRISMHVAKVFTKIGLSEDLEESSARLYAVLHVVILLAEDSISVRGASNLWRSQRGIDSEAMVLEFITEARNVLNLRWMAMQPSFGEDATAFSRMHAALEAIRQRPQATPTVLYYISLASSALNANLFELHGYSTAQASKAEALLKEQRSNKEILSLVACIAGFRQPLTGTATLVRFCNELVSDLTDMVIQENEQQGLEKLIVLNSILNTQEDGTTSITKQRLIFLVKHILPWLGENVSISLKVEVCKALGRILPGMADVYGEHWEQTLSFLVRYWASHVATPEPSAADDKEVLLYNASLRLLAVLKKLAGSGEPNDDLVDALKDNKDRIREGLLCCLRAAAGLEDDVSQPLKVNHELLARQIATLPIEPIADMESLYPLLYTPSQAIELAAFDLLHKQIPVLQEQISFDAALQKKTAQLPDELLSLVLEAPTLDTLADASFDRAMPLSLRGYLYSWRLLFDHFDGSSYRVKEDYIEQLKDGTYLSGLLDLTFNFLGHVRGRPVDVSKFDIQQYIADVEPTPEKDVQWLLTHLYYHSLTHLPSLAKAHYLEIRSRQTSLAIETWTAKFISPLIISSSLSAVSMWADKTAKEDPLESEKFSVRVGHRSKEIHATYLVDEQTMAIKIVLPDAHPLETAKVVGVSRVAVKEEKWQSWLMNCAGVITFSVSITTSFSSPLPLSRRSRFRSANAPTTERQHHRRPDRLAQKRHRRPQRPERVCDLLQHYLRRQAAADETLSDVQTLVPFELFAEVV